MSLELRLVLAGVAAAALACALTPIAISVAGRTGLVDRPTGWKTHGRETPYLGGVAVLAAAAAAACVFAGDLSRVGILLAAAAGLMAVGVVDDRLRLHAMPRVAAEIGAGVVLWSTDLGWTFAGPDWVNLVLTCLWVIGVVNALNLLDLMDGVAGSAAAVAAAGCAVLAAVDGDTSMAVLGVALAAAIAGFLRFNLASPSRVFLGDGGTMAIGLLLAGLTVASVGDHHSGTENLAAAACLVGVPLLDMGSRVVLRLARGISLMTAGPDSMANRLDDRLGSARRVSLVLAMAQAILSAATIAAVLDAPAAVVAVFAGSLVVGGGAAYVLQAESPRPEPAGPGG